MCAAGCLRIKKPQQDGGGMPHCFELFGVFQGNANKRPELSALFQRDLHWNC